MNVEPDVAALIAKINSGALDVYKEQLEGTDLGIYIPSYNDDGTVKIMPDGMSQIEKDLKIVISRKDSPDIIDSDSVAWIGNPLAKDSKCQHGGTASCKHCTTHTSNCKHCTGHKRQTVPDFGMSQPGDTVDAPELDYTKVPEIIKYQQSTLESLAKEGVGLALLHGHSDQYKFTQLPTNMVSVITNGVTRFRSVEEVAKDPSFIPNIFRFKNGKLTPAGGYSAE